VEARNACPRWSADGRRRSSLACAAAISRQLASGGHPVTYQMAVVPERTSSCDGKQSRQTHGYSVMSFNLLADCWVKPEWFPGVRKDLLLDHKTRRSAAMAVIGGWAADIVCLQEVEEHVRTGLLEAFGRIYHISPLSANSPTSARDAEGREIANGTLIMAKRATIPQPEFRSLLLADVGAVSLSIPPVVSSLGDRGLEVVNVHLDWPDSGGRTQIRALAKWAQTDRALVVVGDWNADAKTLSQMAEFQALKLSPLQTTGGTCFPAAKPAMSLDQIATNSLELTLSVGDLGNRVRESRAQLLQISQSDPAIALGLCLATYGSDHLPMLFHIDKPPK
jgi:endonuclease/exonuclease/phosphatase family metal-dependent hydrolase